MNDSERAHSWQPFPQRDAHPIRQCARPNPQEGPFSGYDLADALHAGPETRAGLLDLGLDTEVVAPFRRRCHWCDRFDPERKSGARKSGQHQLSLLPRVDKRDVPLVHLQHHTKVVQGSKLEECLAALDRRAYRLTQVARHHYPGEWREYLRARELVLDKGQL